MERSQITRREFLKFTAGVAGAALVGCLPESFVKTLEAVPTPTKEPTSTSTLTPTNTPEPTATLNFCYNSFYE
ncbi:twin-arginine translocation signal domain-containing protein [Candidatus Microgenomates bacterium]|jgi:anaerobic selenocysteine-containing dehydrogenase|nr:MAG: twin-arginine translocation signal domain-containing protein [Candidatus Microgenomates bacterium]